MYGAVIGDIAGSVYEWKNVKTKEFELFGKRSRCTDDSVMTVAVAAAILKSKRDPDIFSGVLPDLMRKIGRMYPDAGYGGHFFVWLMDQKEGPYGSFGNGSAMRVSPCGLAADSLNEALDLAKRSAEVTHNHKEGIKGAEAAAGAVYLAKTGASREEIRKFAENYYTLNFTLDEIRPSYEFDVTCQGSVPQAIEAFLESTSYEDAIRNAISIGGDSDTIAAITGGIAWSYYRFQNGGKLTPDMEYMAARADLIIEDDLLDIIRLFEETFGLSEESEEIDD